MILNYFTYKNEDFQCSKCGWQGKGADLSYGDLSDTSYICDMDCPVCFEHIGSWQAPLIEEAEKWKRENPSDT